MVGRRRAAHGCTWPGEHVHPLSLDLLYAHRASLLPSEGRGPKGVLCSLAKAGFSACAPSSRAPARKRRGPPSVARAATSSCCLLFFSHVLLWLMHAERLRVVCVRAPSLRHASGVLNFPSSPSLVLRSATLGRILRASLLLSFPA
ncbi:hypothetical protein MRX96_004472 [Rhipicephalus microplus]